MIEALPRDRIEHMFAQKPRPVTRAPALRFAPMPTATPPELTPAQERTLADLGAAGADRPTFPADTGPRLRADLEAGLLEVLGDLGPDEDLTLSKHILGRIHGCEVRLLAEEAADEAFTVTVPL